MKHTILLIAVFIVLLSVMTACSGAGDKTQEAIESGTYDWNAARQKCITDITRVLDVVISGDALSYKQAYSEWQLKVAPSAFLSMFPNTMPPANCSSSVTYLGYSSPENNSAGAEYIAYNARRLNNETLATVSFNIRIKIEQSDSGYIITEFTKVEDVI